MDQNTKLTINELAEMAHVAKSTVSKALNGQKGVSEENRERILKLAEKLKFQPNSSARALAQSRTNAIGFVLPQQASYSMAGEYWTGIMTAVADEVSRHGDSLVVITPPFESTELFSTLEPLIRRRAIDGLIIGAEQLDTRSMLSIEMDGLPFVFIGHNPVLKHYCVEVNSKDGADRVVTALIEQGYKNIGCIAGPEEYVYTQERIQGFITAMERAKLDAHRIINTSYFNEPALENISAMFEKYPELDSIFITAGGEFILNALKVARNAGKDLSSFGLAIFDDSPYLDFLNMKVITAKQPLKEIGKKAAEILFMLLDGKQPKNNIELESIDIVYHG